MNLIALDIETDTEAEPFEDGVPAGLDPRAGAITSIALYSADGSVVFDDTNEARMLTMFRSWLAMHDPSVIVTWNGSCFDLPYLVDRARVHGIYTGIYLVPSEDRPPKYSALPGHDGGYEARIGGHHHVDVAYAYKQWAIDNDVAWSLKPVCKANGIDMVEVDREHVASLSIAERMAYNLSDTVGTLELANALGGRIHLFVDHAPNQLR